MILTPGVIALYKLRCDQCKRKRFRHCEHGDHLELGVAVSVVHPSHGERSEMMRVFITASGAHVEPLRSRHVRAIDVAAVSLDAQMSRSQMSADARSSVSSE